MGKKAYTYMVRCQDQSLYTGWTYDLDKRIIAHNQGKGSKYTRSKGPVTLVYFESFENKTDAMRREVAIKKLNHQKKEALIRSSE